MVYYDPRRPKPWPIRLALKLGAKSDAGAQRLVLIFSLIMILATVYLYLQLFSGSEGIDPAEEQQIMEDFEQANREFEQ